MRNNQNVIGGLDDTLYDKLAKLGLVSNRAGSANNQPAKLASFIDGYLAKRTDIKEGTRINLKQVRRNLVEFFGPDKPLIEVTEGDADEFRLWLADVCQLADNTVLRRCGRAREIFRAAKKRRLIPENPFAEMKDISVHGNGDRQYFLSREDAQKVIDACPEAQWRLLFALSRYGGLRCPSEHLELRWSDVDWDKGRISIRSPKLERYENKKIRVIPIFPELRPFLVDDFEEAEPGTEFVITRYRDANSNLRTQLCRIIGRAGLKPWPKLFQNLRSTRQTELAE